MTLGLSPGVYPREVAIDNTVPAAITRSGAIVGAYAWGPVEEAVLLDNEDSLIAVYYKPNDINYKDWFLSREYLAESGSLRAARVIGKGATNAIIGGAGAGLTLDVNAINGEVVSVAVNDGGAGYQAGDIVEIEGGVVKSEVRITRTNGTGGVITGGLQLLSTGTGYLTDSELATETRKDFLVKNDADFEDGSTELPPVIARFPGALGSSLGISVLRAAEFYGSFYEDRFIVAPNGTVIDLSTPLTVASTTQTYSVANEVLNAEDFTVTYNNAQIVESPAGSPIPGTWSVPRDGNGKATGTILTYHTDEETFNATGATPSFNLVNDDDLDLFSAQVTVAGVSLAPRFDTTGYVPPGYFDIDPETKVLYIGHNRFTGNGDGVTKVYQVSTTASIGVNNAKVNVDGSLKTLVTTVPANAGEVQVQAITGGYSFTFHDNGIPHAGLNNVRIDWGFPLGSIVVSLGRPTTPTSLRAFANMDEVHVVVTDTTGKITGEKDSVIETYQFLSTDPDALREDGTSNFYVKALNQRSRFVRLPKALEHFGDWKLTGGSDGDTPETDDYLNVYQLFTNREDYDATYLIDPVVTGSLSLLLLDLAENRGDGVGFIGAPMVLTVNNKNNELRDVMAYNKNALRSSSYGHFNPTWIRIYDRFNGKYRWIPATGTDAGLYAKTHNEINMWNVPAGYNRGQYRRAEQVSWLPNESERDVLHPNRINFVIRERGSGFILLSQKTMLRKESVFADMNVRFLSVYVKKGTVEALKFVLQEINDEVTRAQVRNTLNPFLALIKAGRGFYQFKVKCDDENNPDTLIQQKKLKVDVYMKPALLVEGIDLALIYTATSISFEEITGV